MAEIVNLRNARKRRNRSSKDQRAEHNRAVYSIPAKLRKGAKKKSQLEISRLDAHRIDRGETQSEES